MIIGIVAHVDAGKTTLSESLLYETGKIKNLGRVDHGNAYLDTDAQEKERGITIFSKMARLNLETTEETKEIVLLDTPGHVDFSAEMERALSVMDYALLVISGTDGVQGHTRTLWRLLKAYHVPTFIFVNKMDMDGTDRLQMGKELRQELSDACLDFTDYKTGAGEFYEEVALCSEELLDTYMSEGSISLELLRQAVKDRKLCPCFYGSALRLQGIGELVQALGDLTEERNYPTEFGGRVYKIGRDEKGARLTYVKLTGGQLATREKLSYLPMQQARPTDRPLAGQGAASGEAASFEEELEETSILEEKVDQIRFYSGNRFESRDSARAGDLVALIGLSMTYPGQGLGFEARKIEPLLAPVLMYRLILPKEISPQEFYGKLVLLEEEDPTLSLVWDSLHREIQVHLMGKVQMEILVRTIKDRFGVVVTFGPGSIVYKETIAEPVEGVGHFEPLRHYAEVHLLISPGEPGSGITVDSACSEDILDKNWQRLIATHVEEREHKGVLTGSALTDLHVTILSGRAHPKHTEGGDFRKATYRAIRQGMKRGKSLLLEPYYRFRLQVPMDQVGRALTDLQQRFGRPEAPEFYQSGSRQMARILGVAPVATMQDYVAEVHSYTQGLGDLSLEVSGYDTCHNPEEVIAQIGYDSEADLRNPTSSVFCAQGSGFVVPWDQVEAYMHLPYAYDPEGESKESGDGLSYQGKAFDASISAQGRDGYHDSWSKSLSSMSESQIDEELADVYAREFGMNRQQQEEENRKKWAGAKPKPTPAHVKLDKRGNPIYPVRKQTEDYYIIDGYNVIFAWPRLKELANSNIDSARDALKDLALNFQAQKGCPVLLVFDAYRVKGNSGKEEFYDGKSRAQKKEEKGNQKPCGVRVVYTREGQLADAFIERAVHELKGKDNYRVTVVTSDGLEQQTVLSLGALRMTSREFMELVESP